MVSRLGKPAHLLLSVILRAKYDTGSTGYKEILTESHARFSVLSRESTTKRTSTISFLNLSATKKSAEAA
jgi:hypothetical protein